MKGFTSNIVWGTFTQPREQSKNMPTLMQTFFFKQQNPWRVSMVCSWFIFFRSFLKQELELIFRRLIFIFRSFSFAFGPHVRIANTFVHLFDALICCFFVSFLLLFYTFFGTFFDVFLTFFCHFFYVFQIFTSFLLFTLC